jgi:hypothetical protein
MPSKSLAQHNLMAAVANNPEFAKKTGIPKSVGQEYVKADKRKSAESRATQQAVNSPKTNHGAGSLFDRGGEVKEPKAMMKKEIAFMEKKGAPKSMIKHEKAEAGMGKMKFAKGGFTKAADGVAKKGKTQAAQVKMTRGGKC